MQSPNQINQIAQSIFSKPVCVYSNYNQPSKELIHILKNSPLVHKFHFVCVDCIAPGGVRSQDYTNLKVILNTYLHYPLQKVPIIILNNNNEIKILHYENQEIADWLTLTLNTINNGKQAQSQNPSQPQSQGQGNPDRLQQLTPNRMIGMLPDYNNDGGGRLNNPGNTRNQQMNNQQAPPIPMRNQMVSQMGTGSGSNISMSGSNISMSIQKQPVDTNNDTDADMVTGFNINEMGSFSDSYGLLTTAYSGVKFEDMSLESSAGLQTFQPWNNVSSIATPNDSGQDMKNKQKSVRFQNDVSENDIKKGLSNNDRSAGSAKMQEFSSNMEQYMAQRKNMDQLIKQQPPLTF
jgi:hypothetical protein